MRNRYWYDLQVLMVTQTVANHTCTLIVYRGQKCDIVRCTNACVAYIGSYTAVGLCFPDGCHCEYDCPP
ncbi:hypothetical protein E2542_SST24412 [Spatholobus suberectus]|nr:hypothetical protein E2542_SST24412 [Spatholobus suberectus]